MARAYGRRRCPGGPYDDSATRLREGAQRGSRPPATFLASYVLQLPHRPVLEASPRSIPRRREAMPRMSSAARCAIVTGLFRTPECTLTKESNDGSVFQTAGVVEVRWSSLGSEQIVRIFPRASVPPGAATMFVACKSGRTRPIATCIGCSRCLAELSIGLMFFCHASHRRQRELSQCATWCRDPRLAAHPP